MPLDGSQLISTEPPQLKQGLRPALARWPLALGHVLNRSTMLLTSFVWQEP
jgi:hypothetical protein